MYADQIAAGRNRSIKERLNGDLAEDFVSYRLGAAKRKRQSDEKWKHDLYEDEGEPKISKSIGLNDLRQKLQKKSAQPAHGSGKDPGVRDLREKLDGIMHSQPSNTDLPKVKRSSEIAETIKKNLQHDQPVPETKKRVKPTSSTKTSQQTSEVDAFLNSLGLGKYVIQFKAEEVDMAALKHMNDDDLKALGVPMGPRKKIMSALEPKPRLDVMQ